jgi:transcriptional regulator of NAD metabolism
MNWFDEQRAIAERLVAVMVEDHKHEVYEHNLEETVRGLMHKLEERDREIVALRNKIHTLTVKEEVSG